MKKEEISKLIDSIHINSANLEYISKTNKINGTLRSEIERVILEYANIERPIKYCEKHPKENLLTALKTPCKDPNE